MSKIENPKVEVPTGIELNDKDIANLTLTTLKDFTKNYAVALTEASNDCLYDELKSQFDAISDLQRDAFELIFRCGWYSLEEADGAKVGEKYNMLNQSFMDLESEDEESESEDEESEEEYEETEEEYDESEENSTEDEENSNKEQ